MKTLKLTDELWNRLDSIPKFDLFGIAYCYYNGLDWSDPFVKPNILFRDIDEAYMKQTVFDYSEQIGYEKEVISKYYGDIPQFGNN